MSQRLSTSVTFQTLEERVSSLESNPPTIDRGFQIGNEAGTGDAVVVANGEAYSGAGIATSGSPRTIWGTNNPSDDDACFLICRNIVGDSLFSHAIRDESTFQSATTGAYTSFDAAPTISSNAGPKYNHSFGHQWRGALDAANGIDIFSGFGSFPVVQQGTVDRLFHFYVGGLTATGGAISQHVGLYVSTLTGGSGTNFGIVVEANDNALLGNLQINGRIVGITDLTASGEFVAKDYHAIGSTTAYHNGGGVFVANTYTIAGYGALQSYSFDGTTYSGKGLALNPDGGQLLVGTGAPSTGAKLEVSGTFTCGNAGFNGAAPLSKPTITGSRGGNAALAGLLTQLAAYGLITDGTTA
jgi:hypothetical protein